MFSLKNIFQKFSWPIITWSLVLLVAQFLVRPPSMKFGPDKYWAVYWVSNYSNAFCRRSFLGTLLSPLGTISHNYWFIALLCWSAMLILWCLLLYAVWRLVNNLPFLSQCIFLTAIIFSPAWTGLLFEVIGDPMQVSFIIFLILFIGLSNDLVFKMQHWIIWLFFGAVSVLISEGSIFFILPSLLVSSFDRSRDSSKKRKACVAFFLGAALAFLAEGFFGRNICFEHQFIYTHCLPPFRSTCTSETLISANSDATKSFFELLSGEMRSNWSRGLFFNFKRLLAAFLLPVIQSAIICRLFQFVSQQHGNHKKCRLLWFWSRWYGLPLLCLAPLGVMAHDWGRFGGYVLMLQTAILVFHHSDLIFKTVETKNSGVLLPTFLNAQGFLMCLILAICTSPFLGAYRINGILNLHFLLPVIILSVICFLIQEKNWPKLVAFNSSKKQNKRGARPSPIAQRGSVREDK